MLYLCLKRTLKSPRVEGKEKWYFLKGSGGVGYVGEGNEHCWSCKSSSCKRNGHLIHHEIWSQDQGNVNSSAPSSFFMTLFSEKRKVPSIWDSNNIILLSYKLAEKGFPYFRNVDVREVVNSSVVGLTEGPLNSWQCPVNQNMIKIWKPLWRDLGQLPLLWKNASRCWMT